MSAGVIAASYVDLAPAAAPTHVNTQAGGASGGTTDISAPIPVGFAAGDTLIFAAFRNQGGSIANPSGWGAPMINITPPGGVLRLLVWMILHAAGTETDPHATGGSASQYASICAAYRGVSAAEGVIANAVDDGAQPCPSGTTATTGADRLVHIAGAEHNTTGPGSIGFDGAVTVRSSGGGPSFFYRMASGDEQRLTAGAVPSRDASSTNGGWMGYAVIPLKG